MGDPASGNWVMEMFKIFFTAILGGVAGGAATLWLPFIRRFFWGPELSLSFDKEIEGCVERTPIRYDDQKTEGYYIRIKVRNIKPNLAKDCRAFLVQIEKKDDDGNFYQIFQDSIQAQWACRSGQGFSSIDLPTGINQFVDVISTMKGVNRIIPKIEMLPFRYENIFSENGMFRYTVQVSGQEVEPKFIRFLFRWRGQWDDFKVELDQTSFPQETDKQGILEQIKDYLHNKFATDKTRPT